MLLELVTFVAGCFAFPVLLVISFLVFLTSILQAVPLKIYRSIAKAAGWKPRQFEVNKTRSGDYDMPYLRSTLEHIPAPVLGLSALMTMVADRRVALAVNAHSTYFQAPIRRLMETLNLVYSLTRNNEGKSKAAASYIAKKHMNIQGPGYSANSQTAQVWVWATLVAALEEGYEWLHPEYGLSTKDDINAYLDEVYTDWCMFARNFGIDQSMLPQNRTLFWKYYDEMKESMLPLNEDSKKLIFGLLAIPQKSYLLPLYPFTWYFKTLAIARLSADYRPFYPPGKKDAFSLTFVRSTFLFLWWNQSHYLRHGLLVVFMNTGYFISPDPTKYKKDHDKLLQSGVDHIAI